MIKIGFRKLGILWGIIFMVKFFLIFQNNSSRMPPGQMTMSKCPLHIFKEQLIPMLCKLYQRTQNIVSYRTGFLKLI